MSRIEITIEDETGPENREACGGSVREAGKSGLDDCLEFWGAESYSEWCSSCQSFYEITITVRNKTKRKGIT